MRYRFRPQLLLVVVPAILILLAVAAWAFFASTDDEDSGGVANMVVVGHTDLENRGYNADVWVHRGFAYVGRWGFVESESSDGEGACAGKAHSGIAVIDTRHPGEPEQVAVLQNPAGTTAEDVVVYTATYGTFEGKDIAVSGIQYCGDDSSDSAAEHGLMFWNVTDPANPVQIGYLKTACCTYGVHEFEIQHRTDLRKAFAYVTVPGSRYPDAASPSGYLDSNGDGDFRLVDITDPTRPVQVSDWGIQDIGGPFSDGQGCDQDANYGHGAEPSADGKLVFVAYWDSGFVTLDLTDPAKPVYKGRTTYPANADGDAHSSNYDEARKLLFAADEDFCMVSEEGTEEGFGYLRVYNMQDLSAPVQIGTYRTPNSVGADNPSGGDYVIHNPLLVGTALYISWYSDGVRVVDVRDPRNPVEVTSFVPPVVNDPSSSSQPGGQANTPFVWGVSVDEETGLIYISDMHSGLWILRQTGR